MEAGRGSKAAAGARGEGASALLLARDERVEGTSVLLLARDARVAERAGFAIKTAPSTTEADLPVEGLRAPRGLGAAAAFPATLGLSLALRGLLTFAGAALLLTTLLAARAAAALARHCRTIKPAAAAPHSRHARAVYRPMLCAVATPAGAADAAARAPALAPPLLPSSGGAGLPVLVEGRAGTVGASALLLSVAAVEEAAGLLLQ